jgi:hypothetical protein
MLFGKIIAVYSENHMKLVNTFCGQSDALLNVKAFGACRYHCALKDLEGPIEGFYSDDFFIPCRLPLIWQYHVPVYPRISGH